MPGVLFALREKLRPTREEMIEFLFTAGAFGMVVANNACISGAREDAKLKLVQQVEWHTVAVEMAGGTQDQAPTAMAISLKNMLGLVCDPVAGLVEVPCVKRNAQEPQMR